MLHDAVEDSNTTLEELEEAFGRDVRHLGQEMTDDKSLPKEVRKKLQIEHAPNPSPRAKQIKITDKICNVHDVTHTSAPDGLWKDGENTFSRLQKSFWGV